MCGRVVVCAGGGVGGRVGRGLCIWRWSGGMGNYMIFVTTMIFKLAVVIIVIMSIATNATFLFFCVHACIHRLEVQLQHLVPGEIREYMQACRHTEQLLYRHAHSNNYFHALNLHAW